MQPANAPSEPDKGQKHGLYATLDVVLRRIDDPVYLFAIAIAILLLIVLVTTLALARGTPNLQFITIVIAILALSGFVVIVSFVGKLAQVEKRQDLQQKRINQLVTLSMSPSVFRHLVGITILKKYLYRENYEVKDGKNADGQDAVGDLFKREFYHLKDRGLIGPLTLEFVKEMHKTNIAGFAIPTDLGLDYLGLRNEDIVNDDECKKWLDPNMLDDNGKKIRENLNVPELKKIKLKVDSSDGTISAQPHDQPAVHP